MFKRLNKKSTPISSQTQVAVNSYTGWAVYEDTQYNSSGSSYAIIENGSVVLPNNAGSKIESQLPTDITTLYDTTGDNPVITGQNGDALAITIEFSVKPTEAGSGIRVKQTIDIGGSVGEIYPREFLLTKGNGVEHFFLTTTTVYTLDTWAANGGIVKVQALGGDIAVWNVRYVIARIHKAR